MDKIVNTLKTITNKSLDLTNKVNDDVKEELVNEFLFYISKVDNNNK